MLHIALVAYCVMNIQDAIIGVWRADASLVIGATFFAALTGYLALRVRKKALMRL